MLVWRPGTKTALGMRERIPSGHPPRAQTHVLPGLPGHAFDYCTSEHWAAPACLCALAVGSPYPCRAVSQVQEQQLYRSWAQMSGIRSSVKMHSQKRGGPQRAQFPWCPAQMLGVQG